MQYVCYKCLASTESNSMPMNKKKSIKCCKCGQRYSPKTGLIIKNEVDKLKKIKHFTGQFIIILIFLSIIPVVLSENFCKDEAIVGVACELGDFFYNNTYDPYKIQCCNISVWYPNGTSDIYMNATGNSSNGFMNFSYTPTLTGDYVAELYCDCTTNEEGTTKQRESRSFTASSDTNPPEYAQIIPETKTQDWGGVGEYHIFNSTWTDDESTVTSVFFEFDGVNYTAINYGGNNWTYNLTSSYGAYNFRWWGTDSYGNVNVTPYYVYTLTRRYEPATGDGGYTPPEFLELPEEVQITMIKNVSVFIFPNEFNGISEEQRIWFYINNSGRNITLMVELTENLHQIMTINGSTTNKFIFYLESDKYSYLALDTFPDNTYSYVGSLRIFDYDTGNILFDVPITMKSTMTDPLRDFIFSVFDGDYMDSVSVLVNSPFEPVILLQRPSGAYLPKIMLFIIPFLLLLFINLRMPPSHRRWKLFVFFMVVIYIAIALLIRGIVL